jgi:hypothetical protein
MIGGFWSPPPAGPPCTLAAPPLLAQIDSNSGGGVTNVDLKANRYLAIKAPPEAAGKQQGIRVHYKTLPPPWDVWNGTKMWVKTPTTQCELGGIGEGGACPVGAATFQYAELSCDAGQAAFLDWTLVPGGVVYVAHPGIVPSNRVGTAVDAVYELQMIDSSCPATDEGSFSAPKVVTQQRWGDMAGPFDPTGGYYVAADGVVSITIDVTAILNKFGNRPGAPIKARSDVEPCIQDLKVNISDVSRDLDAFRNLAFPYRPGMPVAPGNCTSTNPCTYTTELSAGE